MIFARPKAQNKAVGTWAEEGRNEGRGNLWYGARAVVRRSSQKADNKDKRPQHVNVVLAHGRAVFVTMSLEMSASS